MNRPQVPYWRRPLDNPADTSLATLGASPRCEPTPPSTRIAWVARKSRKTGTRGATDSFTPLMFKIISTRITKNSAGSFQMCHWSGSRLNTASPPDAMDTVMVRT